RQPWTRREPQRFTKVLVPIARCLSQQGDLIAAGVLEVLDVSAEISGRADAGRSLEGARQAFRRRRGRIEDAALLLLELLVQAGAAGLAAGNFAGPTPPSLPHPPAQPTSPSFPPPPPPPPPPIHP